MLMKNTILTVMLLGLLVGVGFAQRGRMGTNRATALGDPATFVGPIATAPAAPIAGRPDVTMQQVTEATAARTTVQSSHGALGGVLPPYPRPVSPPDLRVGPNVGAHGKLQR
jgi:hypothetical protein